MDPIIGGALISGASSLLGGLFSNSSNRRAMLEQLKFQREFAKSGIQWRVEDAKKAGLHPLYALGAQGLPQYSPSYSADAVGPALASAGQDIGRAVMARATPAERLAARMQLLEAQSRIGANDAQAAYYNAQAALVDQQNLASVPIPDFSQYARKEPVGVVESSPTAGFGELSPAKITMSRPEEKAIVAGPRNPALREYALPGGGRIMLPDASNLGEALEPLSESWALAYAVYRENVRLYGPEWRSDFLARYLPEWMRGLLGAGPGKFERYEGKKGVDRDVRKWIDEMR